MILRKKSLLGLAMTSLTLGCSKKSDSTSAPAAPQTMEDLKLSSSLAVEVPDSMSKAGGTASGSTLNLTSKKSSEACRVMTETDRVFENLSSIKGMFCHLEVESDKMKFGTKYNINVIGDAGLTNESMSIWVDNTTADSLKVYMCEAGSLKESFTISGFAGEKGLVKGTLASKFSSDEGGSTQEGGVNMEFDFTTKGVKLVKAKMSNTMSGGQFAGSFKNFVDVAIRDSGLSKVTMSNLGSMGDNDFSDQGAVLFDGSIGQALFKGAGEQGGNAYNFTSRSTFDKDGLVVDKSQANEAVTVSTDILPVKLETTFTPDAPAGWDCSGATETLTLDMTDPAKKASHDACNVDHSQEGPQCWGDDFDYGTHE